MCTMYLNSHTIYNNGDNAIDSKRFVKQRFTNKNGTILTLFQGLFSSFIIVWKVELWLSLAKDKLF